MNLTGESKFLLGILGATLLIIAGALFFFTRPVPEPAAIPRETLVSSAAAYRGNPEAATVLVEFSDFQCPACFAAKPYVDALIAKYPADLLFVYRHFPLDQHKEALPAAHAAEAAKLQGKFWEMYDALFAHQQTLSEETIVALAEELDLKMEAFNADRASASVAAIVSADHEQGMTLGINSTPTFFLNGKKLTLYSFADLETAVAQAISQ